MTAECLRDLSQRNQTTVLRALAEKSQAHVALLTGMSESQLSRAKEREGQIEKFCELLAACDLAVVPKAYKLVSPKKLEALETLALENLMHAASAGGWEK